MTLPQALVLAILMATVLGFLFGRWRHDMVAIGSLLACVLAGVVPSADAFAGFGHPAVITVACVLILSSGLQQSGAVDILARVALPQSAGPLVTTAAVTGLAAVLSAFMNNVGALALLMPLAIQIAARHGMPPGKLLMPLAFGSILGGMTTLIGTPPNLIVSGFRREVGPDTFAMFDFTPVGLAIAAAGVVFVVVFARWLVPTRERAGAEGFETSAYLTEARVTSRSKAQGMTLHEVDTVLEEADAQVIGMLRNEVRIAAPSPYRELQRGDILIIEADPEGLASSISALGLRLEEDVADDKEADEASEGARTVDEPAKPEDGKPDGRRAIQSEEIVLTEMAVLPNAAIVGRSATDIRLRSRYHINLLAVSRQGRRSMARLRTMPIRAGDVLLLQGQPEALAEFASQFGCVPLAERALRLPDRRLTATAGGIMGAAVGGAAFGLLPAAISFAGGVLAAMALRVIPPRTVYNAVDWSVIVLLGALIPVAGAMATTGAADLVARVLLETVAQGHAVVALTLIMIVTMTLSDFMNNAATAAVMCPIAIGAAEQLGVSADPFLMAVAIGASCAFLTPIGHQNNTLILGPGGFGFRDYWRLGLPLEFIVVAVGVPMLLVVWPL
jgi:di/tricarboxylate transporter